MGKIDFVVTWVDGNDPEWRAERQKYSPQKINLGNTENRFRDWELMKYWFRGVEKFAPWVNKVYFVTCGHCPEWLNTSHPKLVHIKHSDYIPQECLPTFNSNVIELYFHKIPNISEQFVLFCDDMFLTRDVKECDFFQNGLPCETVCLGQLSALNPNDVYSHSVLNDMAIINKYFDKKKIILENRDKFFSWKYGKNLFRNLLLYPAQFFSCFRVDHLAASYLKSTFETVWSFEKDLLQNATLNKFRTKDDHTHVLMKAWQICTGVITPRTHRWGRYFELGEDIAVFDAIERQKYKMVCLNDSSPDLDFDKYKREIIASFEKILPEKSSFEKNKV